MQNQRLFLSDLIMNATKYVSDDVVGRIEVIIRSVLALGSDVVLKPESDLVSVVGLDSIEAFESVATLHEILGVRIPEDIDPKAITSLRGMADYLVGRYDDSVIERFMTMDIENKLASLRTADDFE